MSRILCDEKYCSGCLACVVACMDQHYDETQTDVISPRLYEKTVSERTGLVRYRTRSCRHCEDAPCMNACPLKVLERTENGFVIIAHRSRCIGCGKCRKACPYDIPRFDRENKIVKCDGCAERVVHGLLPACVKACSTGALSLELEGTAGE